MGLGGGMVWAIGMDDFKNKCGDGRYPLLTEIKNVLSGGCTNPTKPHPTKTPTPDRTTKRPTPTVVPVATTPGNTGSGGGGGCCADGVYINVPGMNKWCTDNCALGNCPPSHCTCSKC